MADSGHLGFHTQSPLHRRFKEKLYRLFLDLASQQCNTEIIRIV